MSASDANADMFRQKADVSARQRRQVSDSEKLERWGPTMTDDSQVVSGARNVRIPWRFFFGEASRCASVAPTWGNGTELRIGAPISLVAPGSSHFDEWDPFPFSLSDQILIQPYKADFP